MKAERTRQLIIEKTAPLFNVKGFEGTSLSDMEKATGLTKGSIYGNFNDKEEIAAEAFKYSMKKVKGMIRTAVEEKPTYKKQIGFIKKQNPVFIGKPFCGEKKYNFPKRGVITFKKEIFNNQPDFVKPFEWFGSGGSATRPILVSQKIRQTIIERKFRGAFFRPLALV